MMASVSDETRGGGGGSGRPISPRPLREARPDVPPAYLSNGLVGLRVGCVPLHDGLAVVQGLVGRDPIMQVEAFARAPYPAAGDLAIDGHRLSAVPGRARFREQRYDLSCGELTTRFSYQVGEARAAGGHFRNGYSKIK